MASEMASEIGSKLARVTLQSLLIRESKRSAAQERNSPDADSDSDTDTDEDACSQSAEVPPLLGMAEQVPGRIKASKCQNWE